MGIFGKKGSTLGTIATLGGLALLSNMFEEKKVVHVHEHHYDGDYDDEDDDDYDPEEARREAEEERREREHERQLELQRIKAEKANPNDMEFVNERIDKKIDTTLLGLGAFILYDFAILCFLSVSGILFGIIFLIVGTIVLLSWFDKKKEKENCKKCVALIVNQGHRSMGEIANVLQCGSEEAYNLVLKIIAEGFIKGFYINKNTRRIEEMRDDIYDSIVEKSNMGNGGKSQKEKCQSCGGNKFVKLRNGVFCKYCGNKIS